jgi:hypothetical protein
MSNAYCEFMKWVEACAEEVRDEVRDEGYTGIDIYERAWQDADSSEYVIYSWRGAEMLDSFPGHMIHEAESEIWDSGEEFRCVRTMLCRLAFYVTYHALVRAYDEVVSEFEEWSEVVENSKDMGV